MNEKQQIKKEEAKNFKEKIKDSYKLPSELPQELKKESEEKSLEVVKEVKEKMEISHLEESQQNNNSKSSSSSSSSDGSKKSPKIKNQKQSTKPNTKIAASLIDTSGRRHSAMITPTIPLEEAPKVSAKRMSLKARLKDMIFDTGKIFTLKNPESIKKSEPVPIYIAPQSETIIVINNYFIFRLQIIM